MENKIIINEYNSRWDCGMPIGNGRLGAMVPGNAGFGIISLNQDSIWYGAYKERDNKDAKKYVSEIRSLLKQGKVKEADKLCYMAMTSSPKYFGAYEPMGQLWAFLNHGKNITDYQRILDLSTAVISVDYKADNVSVHHEYFASYPDNVLVLKISADKPILDAHFNLMRRPCDMGTNIIENNILCMHGQSGPDGVQFDCMLAGQTNGEMNVIGDFLGFEKASEIVLYITASTDFYDKNPRETALKQLKNAINSGYEKLKERHTEDYKKLYKSSEIDFCSNNTEALPLRLDKIRKGEKDSGLLELLFNYGKYLMISASRQGSQAMNLQGIWNNKFAAPWECNYTININTQMNYWIAETTGLSECHEPLFDLIERMALRGEKTAAAMYDCEGFVAHHATNLWGDTSVEGISFPSSVWPMGGAWLSLHMWEHYLFTQDYEFLEKRAFPVMKKAALFFTQYVDKSEDGYYMTGPSLSPENSYVTDQGMIGKHCMAPEMDNQILRALLKCVLSAYKVLDKYDNEYAALENLLSGIRPIRINSNGCILEWDKDYKESDPGHRHLSPLFALYPDYDIVPHRMQTLAEACKRTLHRRLSSDDTVSGYFGWTGAWAAGCYARLENGNMAQECLYGLLCSTSDTLLNNIPVFQIDGNMGGAAAVVEMLIQSNDKEIILLPALPTEIEQGSFKGLRARGGFIVEVTWKNGNLQYAAITSLAGNRCKVKAKGLCGINTDYYVEENSFVFNTKSGEKYLLKFDELK